MSRITMLALAVLPLLAHAQVAIHDGAPEFLGAPQVVNAGLGSQTSPHVSGDYVAYTDYYVGRIRRHNLLSGVDQIIPGPDGSIDSLSDISGASIVFTRYLPPYNHLYAAQFDAADGITQFELSPVANPLRENAAIGGDTVAYQDYSFQQTSLGKADIGISSVAAPDADAHALTYDVLVDREPAVAPDGNSVVFVKCGATCDVYRSVKTASGWSAPAAITPAGGNEAAPDTNGSIVVYASDRTGGGDIYFSVAQSGGGFSEFWLDLPLEQRNPNISGDLIAFESLEPDDSYDIYLFQISTNTLYRLTETAEVTEALTDIFAYESAGASVVRVVWAQDGGDTSTDVYALSAILRSAPPCAEEDPIEVDPAEACADPGDRPVVYDRTITRTGSKPVTVRDEFEADAGDGLLCVDNARATSGSVQLNGRLVVGPNAFKHKVALIAREIALQDENAITSVINGQGGTSFRVRIYGQTPTCEATVRRALTDAEAIQGLRTVYATPQTVKTYSGQRMSVLSSGVRVIEPDSIAIEFGGCSSTGGGVAPWVLFGVAAVWVWLRRPATVRVRRRR